ncbi:MAG: hypothetical protein QF733_08785 [Phycisphaerales bacterium]|jgi:hypothetical protein|nr:hypothetical protein [Phycisphaerales bacterium]
MSDEMLLKAALADGLTTERHWASITQDPDREWAARWLFRTAHGTPDWEQLKEPGDLDSGINTVIENERLDEQEKSNSPFYQMLLEELERSRQRREST